MRSYLLVLGAIAALLMQACVSTGGETMKIDTRDVTGVGDMRDELTLMLRDLGYEPIPIEDPETDQSAYVVRQGDNWVMRFEFVDTRQVRIDARIRMRDGVTRLHFYEPGSQTLRPTSMGLLEALRRRAELEFGRTNVRR